MLLNDTKSQIIDILNASNLPIDAIYYIIREVMQEVEVAYNQVLQQEQEERAAAAHAESDIDSEDLEPTTAEGEETVTEEN